MTNERIDISYINLNGKLIRTEGDSLFFDNKKIGVLFSSPPATSNSNGNIGDLAYDNKYFYICVENNKWIRTALSEW